ncbi:MAG: carboxymuconolactone decarboxylase family protein [Actinomycetia bacterium]|nr:carboxymuconolactone decarboxylase family protein [Actinomycetes bacterium]
MASKQEVLADIEETLGFVPQWMAQIPDHSIESEWSQMKDWEMSDTAIPSKYKQLMGLAVAANIQCDYCVAFHTEGARLHGATDAEIEETCRMAKMTSGWSSYLAGLQIDLQLFKEDIKQISDHMRTKKAA